MALAFRWWGTGWYQGVWHDQIREHAAFTHGSQLIPSKSLGRSPRSNSAGAAHPFVSQPRTSHPPPVPVTRSASSPALHRPDAAGIGSKPSLGY